MIPGFSSSGMLAPVTWVVARVKSLLAGAYNLFPLGGANGGIIVRQKGGIAGTNEIQVYNDGSSTYINSQQNLNIGKAGNNCIQIQAFNISCSNPITLSQSSTLGWSGGPNLQYLAASVWKSNGWIQIANARARNTADVTNATATMANLSDLTMTLIAGRKYTGKLSVKCINSAAAEGIAFDFNGGTATVTSFAAGMGVLASGGTDTVGTNISTSLAGALNFTTLTGETWLVIELTMVCNAGGTFIPRFAENTSATGTATVRLGSYLWLEDMPN